MAQCFSPMEGALLRQGHGIGLQAPYADPFSGTRTVANRGPTPQWNTETHKSRRPRFRVGGRCRLLSPLTQRLAPKRENNFHFVPVLGFLIISVNPHLTDGSITQAHTQLCCCLLSHTAMSWAEGMTMDVTLQEMGHTHMCTACPTPLQVFVTIYCLVLSLSTATIPSFNKMD